MFNSIPLRRWLLKLRNFSMSSWVVSVISLPMRRVLNWTGLMTRSVFMFDKLNKIVQHSCMHDCWHSHEPLHSIIRKFVQSIYYFFNIGPHLFLLRSASTFSVAFVPTNFSRTQSRTSVSGCSFFHVVST